MAAEAAKARQEKMYRQVEALPFRGQLLGFDGYLGRIQDALRAGLTTRHAGMATTLLVVTGLGGVGKTSLICGALRRWLKQEAPPIERVLWATIEQGNERTELDRQQKVDQALERVLWQLGGQLELPIAELATNEQRLSAIVGHLLHCQQRFVIVVDHVKSPADIQLVLTVAKPLLPLAQIVVTSRRDISHNQVQRFRLTELNEAHALELLRLEAKRHGYEPLVDEQAQELYQELGGHPLALKLVAEQVSRMPPAQVLCALHDDSPLAKALYSQVYEPSWQQLSDFSREALLRLMRLPLEGTDWDGLHKVSLICNDAALSQVVNELTALNLLQVTISATGEYTYSLHRLTYRFLQYKSQLKDTL